MPARGSTGCGQRSRGSEERRQEERDTYRPTCVWAESWRLQNAENSAFFSSRSVMLCVERPEGATSLVHLQMLLLGVVLEEARKLGLGGLA